MSTIICYQTRADGVFVGTAMAHSDPLEPGRHALPAGCVATDPPPFNPGQRARWEADAWIIEADPEPHFNGPDTGLLDGWDSLEFVITAVPKPDLTEGQTAAWDGLQWVITDPPVPPEPEPTMPILSNRQFYHQLTVVGRVTQNQAIAAMGGSLAKSPMQDIIDAQQQGDQFRLTMSYLATKFERTDDTVTLMQDHFGLSDEYMDQLFYDAAML